MTLETIATVVGTAIVSSLLTGGAAFKIGLAAAKTEFIARNRLYDEHDRPLYIPREEFNGMSKRRDEQIADLLHRTEQNAGQIVSHTDRLADIDNKVSVMEERQTRVWESIAKDLSHTADTVKAAVAELREISDMQKTLASRMERFDDRKPFRGGQG